MDVEYILFDFIGTTVRDTQNGKSLIIDNFSKAFRLNGFEISDERINKERGKGKKDAIENILKNANANINLSNKIYDDFIELMSGSLDYFIEIEGAQRVFRVLKEKGIKIGLGSGLPLNFMHNLMQHLGWELADFDYFGSSEELGKGRPDPIMILDSMDKLNLRDKTKILKIGDTIMDIQEGKNADVLTAAVLTGTQSKSDLEKEAPMIILNDINELLLMLKD